jgi:hypothetical protein
MSAPRRREPARREPALIRFDRKAQVFLGILALLLLSGTAFKLHGSSIDFWRQMPDPSPHSNVLLGKPRKIRQDEWGFMTPAFISQARSQPAFSPSTLRWGPGRAPLIMNIPVSHWSALVRPQFWGFFALDLEHAFAFYWNMKAFLLLAGIFLLLMLLTGSNFGVSVLGAAWVFFSGFMQWWYSTPAMLPEMVGCVALLLVAAHYVALSPSRWTIAGAALIFSICLLDAILSIYPPFQVPLLYLGIAILVGSLGPRLAAIASGRERTFRIASAVVALGVVAGLVALYYLDARRAIELMRGTLYPGTRMSSGGEVTPAQVFGGVYGFFMSEGSFPRKWFNVCEASNFVLLFPVPVAAILWSAWRKQRVTALEWSLIVYIGVVLSWMILGWPRPLAVASAFGLSQGTRSLLGLGLASILLCCVFLARTRAGLPGGFAPNLIVGAAWFALVVVLALNFNRVTEGFVTGDQIALVSIAAGVAGFLLLLRKRIAFAACLLVPSIWTFGLVNPVTVGLGPILESGFIRKVSPVIRRDPGARWAVYGSWLLADLFKAGGADVFNGTKFVPPLDDFRVIDPGSASIAIYNRYAHVSLVPGQGSDVNFIDSYTNEVNPKSIRGDAYTMAIDPKSDVWPRLGIRYVVLPSEATDPDFLSRAAPVLALPDQAVWIYRLGAPH